MIDRKAANYQFWKDEHTQDEAEWRRLGKDIRALVGEDPDIVFEHPGRQTMGASVFVCARGGTVVTCAATSGYMIEYDNRHLWMKLKRIKSLALRELPRGVGRQPAHRQGHDPAASCRQCTRSPMSGRRRTPVHKNLHEGKIGVLCLAPEEGMGIDDPEFRDKVGADKITLFRRHA